MSKNHNNRKITKDWLMNRNLQFNKDQLILDRFEAGIGGNSNIENKTKNSVEYGT
jgi:hypothetical protein